MEVINLAIEKRAEVGKGAARKLRRSGRIPAVMYRDGNPPLCLQVEPLSLETSLRRQGHRNPIIGFKLDGEEHYCVVKELQRHPISREILHVDFYEVKEDVPVVVRVRFATTGRSQGERKGGVVTVLRKELTVRCLPSKIPPVISVDVTNLDIGARLKVSEVVAPEGVEILYDHDYNVVVVSGAASEPNEAQPETPAQPKT